MPNCVNDNHPFQLRNIFAENWKIFPLGDTAVINIRGIHKEGGRPQNRIFRRADYPDTRHFKAAIEKYAEEINKKGYNVYINLNPIRSGFDGKAAGDADIDYRDLLFIDIDRAESAKVPSTEAELQASLELGVEIATWLSEQGWPNPIKTCSGNGCHLYYVLDHFENNVTDGSLIKAFLSALAAKFDTPDTKIDTVVYNAGRITKFLGTVARKGEQSLERPYRIARIVE
jgi:hypothetical protein